MLTVQIETLGDLTVVECAGRIVRSEAVFRPRDAVMSQAADRIIVLDHLNSGRVAPISGSNP
jgi:hypothetical protein